jgi:hypothetical protein
MVRLKLPAGAGSQLEVSLGRSFWITIANAIAFRNRTNAQVETGKEIEATSDHIDNNVPDSFARRGKLER